MMSSQPSTPQPGTRQRIAQTQRFTSAEPFQPYRDDPTIPPKLHAQTWGGLGPSTSNTLDDNEKSSGGKASSSSFWSCWRHSRLAQCCNMVFRTCHTICTPAIPEEEDDGQHSLLLSEDGAPRPPQQLYYYIDHFNDLSYSCSCGTSDDDGIWMNRNDPAGTIMSGLVWVLISYSILTITLLAKYEGIPVFYSTVYSVLAALALATHVKTTLTDPGSVPASAVPTMRQRAPHQKLSMCSQCQTYKPPGSHHCRICNRCISHMDHHCPWMNNCIGAGNMKHFLLFLMYTWICSVLSLTFFGYNYFFCASEACMYNVILTQLVRIMTVLSFGSLLFTSSMLMNVIYGIMTGIGTIDRLKKKATNSMTDSDEAPVPLVHIFGINPYYTWPFPVDPIFPNYDTVMGYTTPQRLLREQMRLNQRVGTNEGIPAIV